MIDGVYYSNNTKVANIIRKRNDIANLETSVRVERDKEGNLIDVTFLITNNLSNFDMDVADAIYTMYKKNISVITPTNVLRVLSGDGNQSAKKGYNREVIIESIERLRNTEIEISCAKQMENRGEDFEYLGGYSFLVAEPYGNGEKYKIKQYTENDKVEWNEYYGEFFMPLYGYMELLKQVISFPCSLLDVKNVIDGTKFNNSIENIQIKRYLIRRLEIKRYTQSRYEKQTQGDLEAEEKIVYSYRSHQKGGIEEGLFAMLNVRESEYASKDSWKHKRQNLHYKVETILKHYKEIDYIFDFESYKTKRGLYYGMIVKGCIRDPYLAIEAKTKHEKKSSKISGEIDVEYMDIEDIDDGYIDISNYFW